MSTVTIGSYTEMIYDDLATALQRLGTRLGEGHVAFNALSADDQKKALVTARSALDVLGYATGYTTFALRNAYVDADGNYPFRVASYEYAALIAADPDVTQQSDTGSNISSVGAGGAFVNFFNPTSAAKGTAKPLPKSVMDLIGKYLSVDVTDTSGGGTGESASCVNPFGPWVDYDKRGPW
jgi:hypothetical protein